MRNQLMESEREFLRQESGQSSFEYVLIAAGAILIVTMALIIMRHTVLPSINEQAGQSIGNFSNLVAGFNKTK